MMKKILLLMALALPLVFISCSDDKNEPDSPDNHEYVDLGLPSGTLWATCNVGATTPEEYGHYFAWGETTPKDTYSWETYKWCTPRDDNWFETLSKYNRISSYGPVDNKVELELADDAAYVNWGKSWRMPTLEQIQELCSRCIWQWTQRNNVNGYLVTGPNGKSMFLPAAGGRATHLYNDGVCAYFWSRTLCSPQKLSIEASDSGDAYILFFRSFEWEVWYDSRYEGNTVRAVRASKK